MISGKCIDQLHYFLSNFIYRNTLVANMISYVDFYRPKFFLLENVLGMFDWRGHTALAGDDYDGEIMMAAVKFITRAMIGLGSVLLFTQVFIFLHVSTAIKFTSALLMLAIMELHKVGDVSFFWEQDGGPSLLTSQTSTVHALTVFYQSRVVMYSSSMFTVLCPFIPDNYVACLHYTLLIAC